MFDAAKYPLDPTTIPESWPSVEAFAQWWCDSGMPLLTPEGEKIALTDNAASVAVFRRGRFQVELYLIFPGATLMLHEHPGVDVIQMRTNGVFSPSIGPFVYSPDWGVMSATIRKGQAHGSDGGFRSDDGYPMFTFEYWHDRDPCPVAAAWKGETVGPMHDALIAKHYPGRFARPGYADITKPAP
jgi:hypothetical protein